MNKTFLTMALCVVTASAAPAGTGGVIHGTIADAHGGARVANVTVSVNSPGYHTTAEADSKGNFVLFGLPPDAYEVTLIASGYNPAVFQVCVTSNDSEWLSLKLARGNDQDFSAYDQGMANRAHLQHTHDEYNVGRCS